MSKKKTSKFSLKNIRFEVKILICSILLLSGLICTVEIRKSFLLKNPVSEPLTEQEIENLCSIIESKNYERNNPIHKLPYEIRQADLEIFADSAILVNCHTGDILFEKNPDQEIPPASMTKVFLMYTVFEKINEGKATLDDIVPLPPESWASNMPPHSSLMFLGKGQTVTLRELLTGLAVCSGNDASHAIAYYLFGSIDSFLEEVNNQIKKCGLTKTMIVEPSGYSERNVTTAREMAMFARIYISKYPESLELFHSVKSFAYPKKHNIAPEDKNKAPQQFNGKIPDSIWTVIEQPNTNKCLISLPGCDGLKTGYIDESGYNLALTCSRDGQRYLSVTMKGPGNNIVEGDKLRVKDGTTLQEYAFTTFEETRCFTYEDLSITVPVLGSKKDSVKLCIPYELQTCVPKQIIDGNSASIKFYNPPAIYGPVKTGEEYGKAVLLSDGMIIGEAPLVITRDVEKGNVIKRFIDRIIYQRIRKK